MIYAYQKECSNMRVKPVSKLLEQLEVNQNTALESAHANCVDVHIAHSLLVYNDVLPRAHW